jgi:hypothetical protein
VSKDPAKADGEESAYQYCGGDPVGKVDPSGEWARVFSPYPRKNNFDYFLHVMRTNAGYAHMKLRVAVGNGVVGVVAFAAWLYRQVKSGGQWDFKHNWPQRNMKAFRLGRRGSWISLDDFGNLHFGYVFAAVYIPKLVGVAGATANGLLRNPTARQMVHEMKNNYWIRLGYSMYTKYGRYRDANYYGRGKGTRRW